MTRATPSAPASVAPIDSHTAGEPTRIVYEGGPSLGSGTLLQRMQVLERDFPHFRTSVLLEPRGSEVLVGGLLCHPDDPASAAAVIFFNDVGYLGMCGHGTIGLITTLAHMGRIEVGTHRIETPVGSVTAVLHQDCSVSVRNLPSYRYRKALSLQVPGIGLLHGDVAWGGNWFFLVEDHPFTLAAARRAELVEAAIAVRQALTAAGITGHDGAVVDHIEFSSPPQDPRNSDRNFVLCPGTAFDRSPCGTGTSAKMACLFADGRLAAGELWRQEGVLGTVFEGSVDPQPGGSVIPTITGRAYITAESRLLFDPTDPFLTGITF